MPKKTRVRVGSGVVAAGAIALSVAGAVTASGASATTTAVKAPVATAARAADPAANKNLYPFGMPQGGTAVTVPAPPGEPTLSPTITTKTTTRIYGADPFQEAVSVSQHIWTSALPENVPANAADNADRTRAVTLVTPDDPLTDITATPLIHFPDAAPILYVTNKGIPAITLNELKRLGPVGIDRFNHVGAFLVGAAANPGVESQLKAIGVKYYVVTAGDIPQLADTVDKLYGSISNPDFGVGTMPGMEDVVVGSMDGKGWQYVLPATHWVAHMPTGLLWVQRDSIPSPTIDALKRRAGKARIYLFGGPDQISAKVASQLYQYGEVIRVSNDDPVAFNAPPPDSPEATAIAFAKMWDPAGMFGWKMTGPGHGFTLVNINDWQGAIASAPLSHLGFHAPLLLSSNATSLPSDLDSYFTMVSPSFLNTPADGPYNMTYVLGSWDQVSWGEQVRVDTLSEMHNRRVVGSDTGSTYADSQPGA
jgi:hypothetical protein